MYVGIESVKAQHGRIGSGVAAPAGAQMADGSTPTDAGQAGHSKGGVFTTACMYRVGKGALCMRGRMCALCVCIMYVHTSVARTYGISVAVSALLHPVRISVSALCV